MRISDISIRKRIYLLAFILLSGAALSSGVGIWKMNQIGVEIVEIAEQDIPLAEHFTQITIHQLEQAITIEKAMAHAGEDQVNDLRKKFVKLGHDVEEELTLTEGLLEIAIEKAHTEAARKEFTHLLEIAKQTNAAHHIYEKHGEEVLDLLLSGQILAAKEVIKTVEAEQDKLNSELVAALIELEHFTAASAMKAEKDEIAGIQLMIGTSIASLIFGLGVARFIGQSISLPLRDLTSGMTQLANDNLTLSIDHTDKQDEVGQMARAMLIFKENAIKARNLQSETERLKLEQEEADEKLRQEREESRLREEKEQAQRRAEAEKQRLEAEQQEKELQIKAEEEKQAVIRLFGDEVSSLANAAIQGDLSYRLNTSDKENVMLEVCENLNAMLAKVQEGVTGIMDVMSHFAKGDLTKRMEGEFDGAFHKLMMDTNDTGNQLSSAIISIANTAQDVNQASIELRESSSTLSETTESQAANLEETAASVEEISQSASKSSSNATEVHGKTNEASGIARKGGEIVEGAVQAMSEINSSSAEISKIVGMINEIAFQTNLLALNAAVEAARAGDAGKGFAVVADEVRTLAQTTAKSSGEIAQLVTDSSKLIADGVEQVQHTGEILSQIITSIDEVTNTIGEISSASRNQADSISEINQSVTSIDENTQRTAAQVEEAAAMANQLQTQSSNLKDMVDFFKTA